MSYEHSPLPFTAGFRKSPSGVNTLEIADAEGAEIARVYREIDPRYTGLTNAEFICRAVNNHDALLEALETLLFWEGATPDEKIAHAELIEAHAKACQAIAQAKGESK